MNDDDAAASDHGGYGHVSAIDRVVGASVIATLSETGAFRDEANGRACAPVMDYEARDLPDQDEL